MWTWLFAAYIGSLFAVLTMILLGRQMGFGGPSGIRIVFATGLWFIWYPLFALAVLRQQAQEKALLAEAEAEFKGALAKCPAKHCPHCDAHVNELGHSLAAAGTLTICGTCDDTWTHNEDLDKQVLERGGILLRVYSTKTKEES